MERDPNVRARNKKIRFESLHPYTLEYVKILRGSVN